ncbi:MAG: hypothetical protein JO227_15450, partial [Acetobacteraceae bacterium]|nr:hypothetical protein [Acetobacteraceae bacterium]
MTDDQRQLSSVGKARRAILELLALLVMGAPLARKARAGGPTNATNFAQRTPVQGNADSKGGARSLRKNTAGLIDLPATPGPTESIVPPASWDMRQHAMPRIFNTAIAARQLPVIYLDPQGVENDEDRTATRRRTTSFLAGNFIGDGRGNNGPLLQDGGTVYVVARLDAHGNVIPIRTGGRKIEWWAFPGGLKFIGVNPDGSPIQPGQKRPKLIAPDANHGIIDTRASILLQDIDFEGPGGDGGSTAMAHVFFATDGADKRNVAKHVHILRCRHNDGWNGVQGGDESWSCLIEDSDFGDYAPNGVNSDYKSHDQYNHCPTICLRTHHYVPKYGTPFKNRGSYFGISDCFARW